MNYLFAIIFGIVQGITEFLPISSSGHLVMMHEFIKLPVTNELAFDVVLHFATLLAVVFFFKKDICQLIRSWLLSFVGKNDKYSKLAWLIILATIPAGVIGFVFEDFIENRLRSLWVVILMLVLIGLLFILIEKFGKNEKKLINLNWKQSIFIGFSQAIALIPGTSRSGITIIAGMANSLKREEAIKFSFLLSIPVIFGAFIKKAPLAFGGGVSNYEVSIMVVAFIFAFITGFLAIKYFLIFARKRSLIIFAYYRFLLALLLMFYYFFIIN